MCNNPDPLPNPLPLLRQAFYHTPPHNSSTYSSLLHILFKKELIYRRKKNSSKSVHPFICEKQTKSCPKLHQYRFLSGHYFHSIRGLTISSKPTIFFLYTTHKGSRMVSPKTVPMFSFEKWTLSCPKPYQSSWILGSSCFLSKWRMKVESSLFNLLMHEQNWTI